MTNYDRHQAAREAAHKKFQQESARGFALYGYDVTTGTTTPYPSEQEREYIMLELKLLKLKMAASVIGSVGDKLATLDSKQKSCNCGCGGKNASAPRYQTKSLSSGSRQSRNYFAEHMGQICREQYMDAEYTRFCEAYL